ncbi:uncharacterized protein JCM15063_004469 [Sporobolomyces koalae]|uniref:uncharacterized protein n=1 Tax=Sporobolomyces koalae TaxID=500713 RepID=UPI00317DAB8F
MLRSLALLLALSSASYSLARPSIYFDSDLSRRNNDGSGSSSGPSVEIKNGTVEGISLKSFNQEAFLGIPYAQPPVGDLRLRRPRSLEKGFENGVYKADEYSVFCPGFGGDEIGYELGEDCLTINVVRPAGTAENASLPVGFWIYGGGFAMGGSGDRRYNSTWVVQRSVEMEKPIIFVSVNYRVAALGFLDSPELKREGNENMGLYDQRLALHWVQENIAAFGGDPTKVTIWGESAGAMSVSAHLLGYGLNSTELFRGAILESGGPTTENFKTLNDTAPMYAEILDKTGCSSHSSESGQLECLRNLDFDKFNSSVAATSWMPAIDGELVPMAPTQQVDGSTFVKVPLLIGANTDEGTAFGSRGLNNTADIVAAYSARYPYMLNSSVEHLVSLYSEEPSAGSPYNTGDGVLATGLADKRSCSIGGDTSMIAPRRYLAENAAKFSPVYSYRFDTVPQNATIDIGITHFQEVAYVFSNPLKTQNPLGTRPGDAELAKLMTSQWVSFIHDLNPNNNGVDNSIEWPNYQERPENFVFRRNGSFVESDDFRKEQISYINSLGSQLQH